MKRKLLILFFTILFLVVPVGLSANSKKAVEVLKIHYYRYGDDYADWSIWLWPERQEGKVFYFDEENGELKKDDFGVVATINLIGTPYQNKSRIGILLRRGNWVEKDVEFDRYIEVPSTTADGVLDVYFVEGDERVGYSINDPNGPDKSDKIKRAYFSETNKIYFQTTKAVTKADLKVLENGLEIPFTATISGTTGTISLSKNLDFSKSYVLIATFADGSKSYNVTFDGIYDSPEFEQAFAYEGDDLGAVVEANKTSFRLWAPISSKVVLNIYETGTPELFGGSDQKESYEMKKDVKGTWTYTIDKNLHGKYYTYSVTNGSSTFEVIDPYAKSAGVNGIRGMVVDFSKVNPEGFVYGNRPNNIEKATDAIIYELHVRDLTTHSTWNGPDEYRGKFLGLTVEGTSYENVTTGLDHIKELGVTHVQLLPFFDFGVVDESRLDDSTYKNIFNWGYMPLNFNVPEGSYSTDPFDGSKRITELKQVVNAFTKNNIGLIMDVVYNHTGLSADSNFHLILPGYYHRLTRDGAFSNGSGTGNETASERYMVRKFIVDSVTFWAKEYNLSGFRFDLMALHDVETMTAVVNALKEIDENILVYGEPWKGGDTPLDPKKAADKANLDQIPEVGAFNDDIRDAVRGSVFDQKDQGFVQGRYDDYIVNKIKYGVAGGVDFPGINLDHITQKKIWHTEPIKTINYVSAHDNHTLRDKLFLSTDFNQRDYLEAMQKQANAIVLTAQGVPFIHAGAEFMRSKPTSNGYDGNSYESPDSVNQLRWDLKVEHLDVFNYYKGLIALRKTHPAFRLETAAEVIDKLSFLYEDETNIIAYQIDNMDWSIEGEKWGKILVIHNGGEFKKLKLPEVDGEWILVGNGTKIGEEAIKTYQSGSSINILEHETVILYHAEKVTKKKGCLNIFSGVFSSQILLTYFILRKRNDLLIK